MLHELAERHPHVIVLQRLEHGPVSRDPFGDAKAAMTRRKERRRLRLEHQLIHARALLPPDLERVLKTLGRQYAGDGALTLQQCVDCDGAAMNEAVNLGRAHAAAVEHPLHAVLNAKDRVGRGGRHLGLRDQLLIAQQHHVGEGAANVDADLDHCAAAIGVGQLGLGQRRDRHWLDRRPDVRERDVGRVDAALLRN